MQRTAILIVNVIFLAVVTGCIEPKDFRPGLRLSGDVVTEPVDDWSFSDAHRYLFIETATLYLLPHSVTIAGASLDGQLYLWSNDPDQKRWVANVVRNPNVRLKLGDEIYEQRLKIVEDTALQEAILASYAAKYGRPTLPPDERPPARFFRVVERE
jgi:hypothetical protein